MKPDYKFQPDYRLKNNWGIVPAGSIFIFKNKGYVYEFENGGGWIGLPGWFVIQSEDLFEMVNPLKDKPELILTNENMVKLLRNGYLNAGDFTIRMA